MKSRANNSFRFHFEWQKYIAGLSDSIRIDVYDAVIEYAMSGAVIEIGATAQAIFNAIRKDIDEDNEKSASVSKARSEAGKKHRGNQHSRVGQDLEQSGTNGTNVPNLEQMEQMFQTEKTVEDNYTDKEDVTKSKFGTNVPTAENSLNNNINTSSTTSTSKSTSNNNNININKRPQKVFRKPTVEQIADYCMSRNNGIDAESFYDFYESKGWVVGKSPMKDWKACVRTWEKRDREDKPKGMDVGVILRERPKYTKGW